MNIHAHTQKYAHVEDYSEQDLMRKQIHRSTNIMKAIQSRAAE